MRLNIYLNEKNSKEKLIIDFLDSKLNKSAFIKELLYENAYKIKDLNNLNTYKKWNTNQLKRLKLILRMIMNMKKYYP